MNINNLTLSNSYPWILLLFLVLLQGCNSAVENIDKNIEGNRLEKYSCSVPIARYYFNESQSSTVVKDSSRLDPPVNLTIADSDAVTLLSNGLFVLRSTILLSDQDQSTADRITNALRSSNALTAEMWIKPEDLALTGPARIVSMSIGPYDRNFTIGQEADQYILRLRTSTTSKNGKINTSAGEVNPVITDSGTVKKELTHLVLTWDMESTNASYFINGTLSASTALEGDLSTWSDGYPLMIANEVNAVRTWLGEFYFLAIYDCAMQESQIADHFSNGIPTAN